jgi:LacI family transcriptional regulator
MQQDNSQAKIVVWLDGVDRYNRDIMQGIVDYVRKRGLAWQLFLPSDFSESLEVLRTANLDGIIVDPSNIVVANAATHNSAALVWISPHDTGLKFVPTVFINNDELIRRAVSHLTDNGWSNLAMFSQPDAGTMQWAVEREVAFTRIAQNDSRFHSVFRGSAAKVGGLSSQLTSTVEWLASLPKHVGIVGINDARARLVLKACQMGGFEIPSDIGVIGIDNDQLLSELSGVELTSIIQGTFELGQTAARFLHNEMRGIANPPFCKISPSGIHVAASCPHAKRHSPYITRALYFISRNAQRGIKSEQVADHVGISRSKLDLRFKQEVGHSIHEEILNRKIFEAKSLLAETEKAMTLVAANCGFSSVQYMYCVFAREVGCTPKEWRERNTIK